jgi:Xaa-Pro aminopeptidase
MDYTKRLEILQGKMEEKDLNLLIYSSSPCFQYFTGTTIEWRRGIDLQSPFNHVFIPVQGEPAITLSEASAADQQCWIDDLHIVERASDYKELVGKVISDLDPEPKKIGVGKYIHGSTVLDLARECKGALFYDGEHLMDELRMIKEDEEVELLRKAAELTDSVMEMIIPELDSGVSQRELSLEIEMTGRELGASDISFPSTAGFMKTGTEQVNQPFTFPVHKGLEEDTSIAFDIGFVLNGYCSDWGRSMYFGNPEPDMKLAYEALQNSVVTTIEEIEPQVTAVSDIFPSIEAKLDAEGFGDYLRARLKNRTVGHQIGVEVHENPWLKPEEKTLLMEGMVLCIEPKLWKKGQYYLRVEDMVLITSDGAESLTHFDRTQFQI